MHGKRKGIAKLCAFLLFAVPLFAQNAYLRTTIKSGSTYPYCIPWIDSGAHPAVVWDSASAGNYLEVFPDTQYQTINGWGGCFQERFWDAIQVLSPAGQDSIYRALFDTSGCNFNFCRVPIGCCDFDDSTKPISLNDSAGDYQMQYFSLHRDSTKKIPMMKTAQAINPNLHFWGCPWSPPAWMHDNNQYSSGNIKSDTLTQQAYSLYLEKFVQGYKAAGINMDMICCQNEPTITSGGYPKCGWSASLETSFYKNYLIPRFQRDSISTKILLGVFCCGNYSDWVTGIMKDSTVAADVAYTSHSYQNPDWGLKAVVDYPSIPYMETEAPFGAGPPGNDQQNWSTGQSEFDNVASFMNDSTSVYTMWNMVNDSSGRSGWGWSQNVMIQVYASTKQVNYNPHYFAMKHFSYYVKPGAKAIGRLAKGTSPGPTCVFRNPNGDIIIVLEESTSTTSAFPYSIKFNGQMYSFVLPGNSFNTIKIACGSAVQPAPKVEHAAAAPVTSRARISNSTLYFSSSALAGAQEMHITLTDLAGRVIWSGHRSTLLAGQQVFSVRSAQSGLHSGAYLLTAQIKNKSGAVTRIENKVLATN